MSVIPQQIELNAENVVTLLKSYVNKGYQEAKIFTFEEGALLHKTFRFLQGLEEDAVMDIKTSYATIFRALEVSNINKAFTLDDASVIHKVVGWVKTNVLKIAEPAVAPVVAAVEKITEI
jgi:hypothetical protein